MNKKERGFTSRRHPELDSGSSRIFNKGFTLLEVLVVVLIIGVLAAVAVPQYQKAVLKSRYTALMPMAKAVADAQEVFHLSNGHYAANDEKDLLDISSPSAENTSITIGDKDGYDYVLAQRTDIPQAHYIIYQKNSSNFPGEAHCEALKGDNQAIWLCEKALNGKRIGGSLTTNYQTYVLEGSGNGITATAADTITANAVCSAEETSNSYCEIYSNRDGSKTKRTCSQNPAEPFTVVWGCSPESSPCVNAPVCTYTTYNTDGGHTVCESYSEETGKCMVSSEGQTTVCGIYGTGVLYTSCQTTYDPYEMEYDEDGKKVSEKQCEDSSCRGSILTTYDTNGSYDQQTRRCAGGNRINAEGLCPNGYSTGWDSKYDANGKKTSSRTCIGSGITEDGTCTTYSSGWDSKYDANGNQTSSRTCVSNSDCSAYSSGWDSQYDANGHQTSLRTCSGSGITEDGTCTTYSSGWDSQYDANGHQTSSRTCVSNSDCSTYSSGWDSQYDANGNQTSQRVCADGNCSAYNSGWDKTYDNNNREITSRTCGSDISNGACNSYTAGTNTTYTANGYTKTSCTEWTGTNCSGSWVTSGSKVGNKKVVCGGTVTASGCSGLWQIETDTVCSGNAVCPRTPTIRCRNGVNFETATCL